MAVYYIDAVNGKAENNALSENTPGLDYKKLNIKPGDTVLFKRGNFIRGKLCTMQGEEGKPVTYGAYGEGEMPVFCGSVQLCRPELWTEEEENIWVCDAVKNDEAANFVFNHGKTFGTLRWTKEELSDQGDFFDNSFGEMEAFNRVLQEHKIYLYSEGNPARYYSDIECVVYGERNLADNGHDIVFENLRFINSGVHAISGEGLSRNMRVENCRFECIGGAVWDKKQRIRFGNAVEMWNVCENVEVSGCLFDNIYDSAVTHQGDKSCMQADNLVITDNIFLRCGMGAYEQRDRLTKFAVFNNNICCDAGEGFSKLGEAMPRRSEIWPEPMGHHVFLWRIGNEESGHLEIKDNIFCNAPYGAAIYSIISPQAEKLTELEGNLYYTENKKLLNRWNGRNYSSFEEYCPSEKNSVYRRPEISEFIKNWNKLYVKQI